MRIAIVGAGALGLYYGAKLQRGGADVRFLLRSDYDAIRQGGLTVFSIDGNFVLPQIAAYRSPHDIGTVDLVVVGLKTFANDCFEQLIAPLLGPETEILDLQNGLGNEEELARLFGGERIIGGVAFLCANRDEPGTVRHLGAGRIVIGEFVRQDPARLERVASLFRAGGIDCRIVEDLKKALWEKLVWNIPFNGLSALLLQPVDRMLANPSLRRLVRDIMGEIVQAANAQGLSSRITEAYADSLIPFTEAMGAYRPSMLIDREEGRPLEIEAIMRVPSSFAAERGSAMPRVEMLADLLENVAGYPPLEAHHG